MEVEFIIPILYEFFSFVNLHVAALQLGGIVREKKKEKSHCILALMINF